MIDRRRFNAALGLSALSLSAGAGLGRASAKPRYSGPNVVVVRFGGGVRRRETIDKAHSYAPFLINDLAKRGTLIPDVTIAQIEGVDTSHAEGTLNILTGRYLSYRDAGSKALEDRLEPTQPTLFEYLRRTFAIPSHQALLINGEDRPQEEFFTYGMHRHYGITFRSEMLSLHRFKLYKFGRILEEASATDEAMQEAQDQYRKLLNVDTRDMAPKQSTAVEQFWAGWRNHYGDSGLKNPRGDRLLTELAIRALANLRPRLMMINYQDPDYVHWGNASHYTRAISVIDEGLKQLVKAVDADPEYRDNTVFVVTPDCSRDANPLMDLPFQHHFNSRSAHETWALIFGPGIAADRVLDKPVDQSAIAPTVGAIMGFHAGESEGSVVSEIFT